MVTGAFAAQGSDLTCGSPGSRWRSCCWCSRAFEAAIVLPPAIAHPGV